MKKIIELLICIFSTSMIYGNETVRIESYPELNWQITAGRVEMDEQNKTAFDPLTPNSPDAIWYESPFWWSAHSWCRVGKNWQHPGENMPSVRCFTVPQDGELLLSGTVKKLHLAPETDGIVAIIRHNDNVIWTKEIAGGDGKGIDYSLTVSAKKGDNLRFIVSPQKSIVCDTTGWDPKITWKNDPKKIYRASDAFALKSVNKEGMESSPWSYEKEFSQKNSMAPFPKGVDSNFSLMIQYEWIREDGIVPENAESFLKAAQNHLAKTEVLLIDLKDEWDEVTVEKKQIRFKQLSEELGKVSKTDLRGSELIYAKIRGFKRQLAFSNPLLKFGELLFCKRRPTSYSHLVAQYLGWRARSGGTLCVLKEPGKSLECRDIIGKQLPLGNFLEPKLSWDAKKIVFSYVNLANEKIYDPYKVHYSDPDEGFFHVYSVNIDGTDLRQLTQGSYDDLMPNWLPDDDIVFSSTRRKGYARCFWWGFGRRWNVYTTYRMKPDGKEIKQLSWHDTNEWFPTSSHNGQIVYARWDYIDRDAVTHQNFWSMRPDGTNPQAVWGNATPSPHCTFQATPIPNSQKYVFTASAHHTVTGGSLVLLDPGAGVDGEQSLHRITPSVPFPESETRDIKEFYDSPFPLSEKYFLVSYSPWPIRWEGDQPNLDNGLGIYLYDVFGNRELICRNSKIGCTNPIPIQERPKPGLLASLLPTKEVPDYGEMTITDVYQGLGSGIERGKIKEIRIVQILPKTTRDADDPAIGLAGEENARVVLGTIPVEKDGSAFFKVPAEKPFLLQVLDEKGYAYQTMRSLTYLQKGERVSCTGCHETRESSGYSVKSGLPGTFGAERPLAMRRESSQIDPGKLGGRAFSYVETVQPILDRHCVSCHNDKQTDGGVNLTGQPEGAFTKSYITLCRNKQEFWGDNGKQPERLAKALVPRFGGRNTIQMTEPGGKYGALGSHFMTLINKGHEKVVLSSEEIRMLAAWIDLNAVFYGVYEKEEQEKQRRGEIVAIPEVQ